MVGIGIGLLKKAGVSPSEDGGEVLIGIFGIGLLRRGEWSGGNLGIGRG